MQFSILYHWWVSADHLITMPSDECHRTLLVISQHLFRYWLGADRLSAISCVNILTQFCVTIWHHEATKTPQIHNQVIVPPAQQSCRGYIGFTPSVRPSIHLSIHLTHIQCPLCSACSSVWIHFIFIHLIKQLQTMCWELSFYIKFQNVNFLHFF